MARILDETYSVRRPFVYCEVWVGREDGEEVVESAFGYGFAKCSSHDKWDESFGRALARNEALAMAYYNLYMDRRENLILRRFHEPFICKECRAKMENVIPFQSAKSALPETDGDAA